MILEEQPAKVAEAVKLFLQGLGYTTVRGAKLRSSSLANTPIKVLFSAIKRFEHTHLHQIHIVKITTLTLRQVLFIPMHVGMYLQWLR